MRIICVAGLTVLSACGGSNGILGNAPSASTGYASVGDSVTIDDISVTSSTPVLVFNADGSREIVSREITFTPSSGGDVMTAVVDGTTIVMNWDSDIGGWSGTVGTAEARLFPGDLSSDEQLGSGYFAYYDNDSGPDNFSNLAMHVGGFNTDPAEVGAQTGAATYTGFTSMILTHGGGDNVFAYGTSEFNIDFDANSIDGTLIVTTDFADTSGRETAENAEITVNGGTIEGNAFETTYSLNPTDFAMTTFAGGTVEGQFFGVDAANVGGNFYGSGTSDSGSTNVLMQGAFGAE